MQPSLLLVVHYVLHTPVASGARPGIWDWDTVIKVYVSMNSEVMATLLSCQLKVTCVPFSVVFLTCSTVQGLSVSGSVKRELMNTFFTLFFPFMV